MKNQSKIQLSALETELVGNTEWILTKNGIMKKLRSLLERLMADQQEIIHSLKPALPSEVKGSVPKISRGENYQGLPYLVLDQPRHFNKTDILLIRTFFWWGNFFSTTLQLSGTHKTAHAAKISASFMLLKENDYYLCINEDPWEHHFGEDNYKPIHLFTQAAFDTIILQQPFIKISRKIKLEHWENAEELLTGNFRQLIHLLVA